ACLKPLSDVLPTLTKPYDSTPPLARTRTASPHAKTRPLLSSTIPRRFAATGIALADVSGRCVVVVTSRLLDRRVIHGPTSSPSLPPTSAPLFAVREPAVTEKNVPTLDSVTSFPLP